MFRKGRGEKRPIGAPGVDFSNPAVQDLVDKLSEQPHVKAAAVPLQQMIAGMRDMTLDRMPLLEYSLLWQLGQLMAWADNPPPTHPVKLPEGAPLYVSDAWRNAVVAVMLPENEIAAPHLGVTDETVERFRDWAVHGCHAIAREPSRMQWMHQAVMDGCFEAQNKNAVPGTSPVELFYSVVWTVVVAGTGDPRAVSESAAGISLSFHLLTQAIRDLRTGPSPDG